MKIIKEQIKTISLVLSAQEFEKGGIYRPLSFCYSTVVDGDFIAYNSLTGEMVQLSSEEYELLGRESFVADENAAELVAHWFLVPVEHDDIQLSEEITSFAKVFEQKKGITRYTVFTTMDCNARCFYCYENGRTKEPMKEETAKEVVSFVDKNAPAGEKIAFTWYGGEPLYNKKIIDIITSGLKEKNREFTSFMISNGYLFDDETIAHAVNDWKLEKVQITLDGTEEVYNKAKAYIDAEGKNPFKIVTDNIEKLLCAGIRVAIRMNMGEHNREDLFELVKWIAKRYAGYENLTVYSHLLFAYSKSEEKNTAAMKIAEDMLLLDRLVIQSGFAVSGRLHHNIKINRCMADSSNAISITTSGKIVKCDHYSENEFVGDLTEGITNKGKLAEFCEKYNSKELCKGCFAYPKCIKLKKCPESPICGKADRFIAEERLRNKVRDAYLLAKRKSK